MPDVNPATYPAFLQGGGTMGALMRAKDWTTTNLGDPNTWPQSLGASLSLLLQSNFPMFIWWGDDMIMFYNDAYFPIAGNKHPHALGAKGFEIWSEVWTDISPMLQQVKQTKQPTWAEDQLLLIDRKGFLEEAYFTFSHSAIIGDTGKVEGIFCVVTETTEKVLANRKAKESEQNLRNTILQSPVAMCILRGTDHVVEIANERMYELWGRGAGEVQGKPIFSGLPEVAGMGLEQLLTDVYTSGQTYRGSERPVTVPRDGKVETIFIDFVYQPLRDGDGEVSGIIVVATDVTSQVLKQRSLEENEAELQKRVAERTAELDNQKAFIASILDASMDGIYALKAVRNDNDEIKDFRYLFANNQVAELLGMEVQQIVGSDMLDLLPENKANGFFDLFCKQLMSGETVRGETHFVAQNIDRWFDYVIVPIDEETVVISIEDITDKKQAAIRLEEQRNLLDSILRNSSNGISVTEMIRNEKGEVVDATTMIANDAAVKFTGLPRDVYLTKTAVEIDRNILGSPYGQMCLRTLTTGEPSFSQYFLEMTGRWLELTISRLDDNHLIHIFTDVTPIKEAQLQLERSVEELKQSNQNLEQFAYAASHDLKEPMRKIELFTDRLKERLHDKLQSEDEHYFNRILHAIHRMNNLIDDLLMYSHVSRGAVLDETVDLNEKLKRVLEDLEVEVEQTNAIITVGNLPTIKGHRRQLQQLFQNLISNAIKYQRPGVRPEVIISSRLVNGTDEEISDKTDNKTQQFHLIDVSDNGIGFEPEDAERIFNVFTRLHGNAEYKGTGVGLSIARKVAENHGGKIWAESRPSEGARFRILLPVQ